MKYGSKRAGFKHMEILIGDYDNRVIGLYDAKHFSDHAECLSKQLGDDNRQDVSLFFCMRHILMHCRNPTADAMASSIKVRARCKQN